MFICWTIINLWSGNTVKVAKIFFHTIIFSVVNFVYYCYETIGVSLETRYHAGGRPSSHRPMKKSKRTPRGKNFPWKIFCPQGLSTPGWGRLFHLMVYERVILIDSKFLIVCIKKAYDLNQKITACWLKVQLL